MEAENEHLKRAIDILRHENAELREMNHNLKQSLEKAVRSQPKPQFGPRSSRTSNSQPETRSETSDAQVLALIRQLLDTQDRLTVAEQVTAVTQRRQLIQEGVYENLPTSGTYEKLRFDPTEEHRYTALRFTTYAGC